MISFFDAAIQRLQARIASCLSADVTQFPQFISRQFVLRIFVLIFCMVVPISLQAQAPSATPEQLKRWKDAHGQKLVEKDDAEQQRKLIVRKERGVRQRVQQLEAELTAREKELADYERQIAQNQHRIKKLRAELTKRRQEHERQKQLFAKRIRAIYKVGYNGRQLHMLKMLLGTENLADFLNKYKYLSVIAEEDQRMLNLLQAQQQQIVATSIELTDEVKSLETASKAAEAKRVRIQTQKQEQEKLLAQYLREKDLNRQSLETIKAEIATYEDRLGIMGSDRVNDKADKIQSIHKELLGQLPWPVAGEIVPNQARYDKGITIQAPRESSVRCIADGVVAKTIPSIVGYGNTILVSHGNGYISVYAHLSEIKIRPGETVYANEVIGSVGDTGSLEGPALYFELWHNYGRLNTRKWLAKRQ